MQFRLISLVPLAVGGLFAQDATPVMQPAAPPAPLAQQLNQTPPAPKADDVQVPAGTTVPLSLINAISTKHSQTGDHVYLETAVPIVANGRVVIPVGSYVAGTVTEVKKPGRVKGRGELYIRFDSLTLPNGVTRDFRSRMENVDASSRGHMDRGEGKVESDGNVASDARTVAETTATRSIDRRHQPAQRSLARGHGTWRRRRGRSRRRINRRPRQPRTRRHPLPWQHRRNGARPPP